MINANLIAGLEPTQQYDPIAEFTKAQGVKNLLQQQQIGQQNLSLNAQRLESERQAMQKAKRIEGDTVKFGEIYHQAGGDPVKAVEMGSAAGIHPDILDKFQKDVADLAAKKAATAKDTSQAEQNTSEANKNNLAVEQGRNAQLLDLVDQYRAIPPEQQAAAWPTIFQRAMQIDPKTAEHLSADQPPTNEALTPIRSGLVTNDYVLKEAKAKQEADKAAQEATTAADTHLLAPSLQAKAANEAITTKPNESGLTPAQVAENSRAAAVLAETKKRDEATAANQRIETGLKQKQFEAEYGGDAVKGWVATIKDNPDAISEVPAKLRTGVQQEFAKQTGLPLPKPLTGPTKTQETAARNGLQALAQVAQDIHDPEIQSRLGAVMGRLGEVEQDAGATIGLSPQAAAKAQRLRTNMRMMAMQEGRSVFGGRIPQALMEKFQSSSPNVNMEPGLLQGALAGMQDAGMRALDTADQERFGGKMRNRADRGVSTVDLSTGKKKITVAAPDGTSHDFDTQAQADAFKKLAGIR